MKDLVEEIDQHILKIQDFPKKGILYKDISPVFLNPDLCDRIVQALVQNSKGKIDVVCGIESRGFLLGTEIARELKVPFVMVRKAGKLPPPVISKEYNLEYGTAKIEIKEGYVKPGQRVLIHDDILATGGTAVACAELIESCGAIVEQFNFLVELSSLNGGENLHSYTNNIVSLLKY